LKPFIRLIIVLMPFMYMVFIWVLSSLPQDAIVQTPFSFDHMLKESLHLIEFAILYGFFVLSFLVQQKFSEKTNILAAWIAILYGLVDEIHQYFVPYRSAQVIDLVKDAIGVLVLYWVCKRGYFSDSSSVIGKWMHAVERYFHK
jgi:VanZ family protein